MCNNKSKITLSKFIEENYKLFTSLAACIAVTIFAKNLPIKFFSYGISLIFLIVSFLLLTEIFVRVVTSKGSFKVVLMENLLLWAIGLLLLDIIVEHTIPIFIVLSLFLFVAISSAILLSFPSLRKNDYKIIFYKKNKFNILKAIICIFVLIVILLVSVVVTAGIIYITYKIFGNLFIDMKKFFVDFGK